MVLICVRHAQSIFNALGRSKPDCCLSAAGIKQASTLKGHFCHIVCSPMLRTQQTLRLSQLTYSSYEADDDARERRDDICDFTAHEPTVRESHIAFAARIQRLNVKLSHLETVHEQVLLVSHAYVIIALQRIRNKQSLPMDDDDACKIAQEYTPASVPNAQLILLPSTPSVAHRYTSKCDGSSCQNKSAVLP
jgi:broad specificity phosphatase PhoE